MNDNYIAAANCVPTSSDPHGRAALLLTESLIHGLCEKGVLSAYEAVEIAERAQDVQQLKTIEADKPEPAMWQAHTLLSSIATSLRADTVGA